MPNLYRIAVLSVLGAFTGCASINSTSFSNLSSAYREVVEEYSNDNILLNIVRTSKNMPMSFLDIPSVIGSGTVQANAGATRTRNLGNSNSPDSVNSGSLGLSVNNGFTFTQASLDNAQFMQSFLKQIPLDMLRFKGTETVLPREVSYTLLIESIELRSDNRIIQSLPNDPMDPDYVWFQQVLYLLIGAGLTNETRSTTTPLGPPIEKAQLTRSLESWGQAVIDGLAKGSLSLNRTSVNGAEAYQLVRNDSRPRMCVNRFRARQLMPGMLNASAFCDDSPELGAPDETTVEIMKKFMSVYRGATNLEMVIAIRSPGNVFNFLGSVLNAQLPENGSRMLMIKPSMSAAGKYNQLYREPRPLFKVHKSEDPANRIASVKYRGSTYSIADDDNSYTKQVLEFMSTLVTISKIAGAIPQVPAIVVH